MKLIYIANIKIPTGSAHGVQIMKMCEAFTFSGVEVELVVPGFFGEAKEDPFLYFNVKKNFKIIKLPNLDLMKFGKTGYRIQNILFSIMVTFYCIFKKTDMIYSRDEFPLLLLSLFKNNLVWEAHMPRYNHVVRLLTRRINKIVTISQGLKNFYIKKGKPEEIIEVAHDGVDLEEFSTLATKEEAQKHLDIITDKPVVMYIGRIDPWKGVETLLKVSTKMPEIQVVVIGDGSQLDEFKKTYPQVFFTGMLPYKELSFNQQAADVLVIPNSGKSEVSRLYTSPLKVFAHMTSMVPIVASDLPSLREILNPQSSVLVEADNVDALVEGVRWALKEKAKALQMAEKAQKDVKDYTWNKRANSIIKFIKND